jgi:hypothetical protein
MSDLRVKLDLKCSSSFPIVSTKWVGMKNINVYLLTVQQTIHFCVC